MDTYYFGNPSKDKIIRELNGAFAHYFYFDSILTLITDDDEVLNGCLLKGNCKLIINNEEFSLNQFDLFYLPPKNKIEIIPESNSNCKISYVKNQIRNKLESSFEIKTYNKEKFVPRGELNPKDSITTYRSVWTAFKNGYFMSGFTNIPNEALKKGVLTSVNLEKDNDGFTQIFPHTHPEFPELYIYCIDDTTTAVTQYLINLEGKSICKDLQDGEGLFFPGSLGHINFGKPTYKDLKYCMYLWIIPTYGLKEEITPITLKANI